MSLTKPTKNLNVSVVKPDEAFAVAVSGGADSMALLLMAQEWAESQKGKLIALTVDHRLRRESGEEAAQVKTWCVAYGIEHHTLVWNDPQPKQADARSARYGLLIEWCKAHAVRQLLTAHHLGDQIETLFFRLARGSNLRGLSCIADQSEIDGISIVRPLLQTSKQSLIDYLQARNQHWIEDPSNHKMNYTRNIIRAQLQSLPNYDDIETRAAAVIDVFARFRKKLDVRIKSAMHSAFCSEGTLHFIDSNAFTQLPAELGLLSLAEYIRQLSGEDHPPRTAKLERLYAWLLAPDHNRMSLAHLDFTYAPEQRRFCIRKVA